ncbi:MAG: hypothetical protein LBO82_02015 [Synergistaceae bacterium]|nr:hypothetical protein [Synergistaceae bacterium]
MNADFPDAHHRHWQDAEVLFSASRFANADHLYGLSAECGLKHLMNLFGMPLDKRNRPCVQDDRVHINKLWSRYEIYQSGRQAANYVLPQTNPFDDWNVSQRYAHQNAFDKGRVDSHRKGAGMVRDLMRKVGMEGLQ